ncbi:hypothetical protein PCASD_25759 [Puccinia coronata f. sp. avenae]|uniref:Uncharacterized protein n=1 Tax=Puccinia coronata f. sp. avenae TaxID=200324 RepID=A0A2N5RXQ2_9BASI|nr:hypothetical protein PCASD_25759 [Puccinia coronata f. sp. avenae]
MQINGPNNASEVNELIEPLAPLPFDIPNTSETQESWLAPSIPNSNHRPAFKLFFEPTPGGLPSQGAPSQTQSKELEQAQSLSNARSPKEPLRPIHIDYMVYNRVAPTPLAGKKKGAAKGWEKVTPAEDIVWKTSITDWTWLRSRLRTVWGPFAGFASSSITALNGAKSNYSVTSDADLLHFAEAVTQSPMGKVIIKITMDDPDLHAKAKAQDDNLAMNYGPDDKRRALELIKTRQAVNPKQTSMPVTPLLCCRHNGAHQQMLRLGLRDNANQGSQGSKEINQD